MSDIFVFTIVYGPTGSSESYFYKDLKTAEKQMGLFGAEDGFLITDDFGNQGRIIGDVLSVRISNMEKSMKINTEQSLLQARAQARFQRLCAADPTLKLGGGPAGQVLPFGRG